MNILGNIILCFGLSASFVLKSANPKAIAKGCCKPVAPGGIQYKEASTIDFDDEFESRGYGGNRKPGNRSRESVQDCENNCNSVYINDLKMCKFSNNEGQCAFSAVLRRSRCIDACNGR